MSNFGTLPGFAISGKAGSGKTTLAHTIELQLVWLGGNPVLLSFGSYLKAELYARTGLTKNDPGGREELLALGAKMREEEPGVFVRALEERWGRERREGRIPIIDDLRMWDEMEWCDRNFLYNVRVWAPDEERELRLERDGGTKSIVSSQDVTECDLDGGHVEWNTVVENDGPLTHCLFCEAQRIVVSACASWAALGGALDQGAVPTRS